MGLGEAQFIKKEFEGIDELNLHVYMRRRVYCVMLMCLMLGPLAGCAGAVVEQTSDVVIGVVKIPFKIGKAIVDLVVGTDDEEDK